MESIALRPRKATEIVDAAIEVYRRNPLQFILLTAVVHVPWLILQIMFVGDVTSMEAVVRSSLIGVGTLITYFVMSGLIVYMASELYLGREIDAFETVRRMWRRLPAVFLASVMKSVAIAIGLLFFLFPAVYISAEYFAVIPVVVLEGRGPYSAFGRSRTLSRDTKTHILSALGLVVLIRFVVQISVAIVVTLIPMIALRHVAVAVASILIYPLIGIAEALIYYDVRIRKEGFDIEMMASQSVGSAPAAL